MAAATDLHVGWMLDVVGVPPPGVPVMLTPRGLKNHIAIIAQSGSGKSFMLGRLIEEIASKTRARFVILDPNSDFIKLSEVDPLAWSNSRLQPWFDPGDTLLNFQKRWAPLEFDLITNRDPESLGLKHALAHITPISLSWAQLSNSEQANYLEFSMIADPMEMYSLHQVTSFVERKSKENKNAALSPTLERFVQCAGALWGSTLGKEDALDFPSDWPVSEIARAPGEVSTTAALNLYGRAHELNGLDIFDRGEEKDALNSKVRHLGEAKSPKRILLVDLASLPGYRQRLVVADAALAALWDVARESWISAIKEPSEKDSRFPVFIVVDEAHNLAPAEPESDTARIVLDTLVRIATEGRKYGLFLILVTQRPSRLHPSILSQCDNLCLLKMNNRLDLQLVENMFGFLPSGMVERTRNFRTGDALLCGNLVEKPVYLHAAPRRTAEGGRNLEDGFWLQDPV